MVVEVEDEEEDEEEQWRVDWGEAVEGRESEGNLFEAEKKNWTSGGNSAENLEAQGANWNPLTTS